MDEDGASVAVSVCIPTYNYAELVGEAVESVLAQTYGDFELIVVDDASTDHTDEVMARYERDPRLRYVKNAENRGLFDNFNYCAELARGRYLKFLCADDLLHPDFLRDTCAVIESSAAVGLVTTSHFQIDERGSKIAIEYAPFGDRKVVDRREAIEMLIEWHYVVGRPTNVLLRRDAFEEVGGFDGAFAPPGDLHLWLKILQHHDLGVVREPRCSVRVHAGKSHEFSHDPTGTVFEVWRDAASWPGALVTEAGLRRATYREARRCTIFLLGALLGGRTEQARRIAAYTRPNIRLAKFLPRFIVEVPRIVLGFVTRIVANRTGRLLVFDPTARLGPRISP